MYKPRGGRRGGWQGRRQPGQGFRFKGVSRREPASSSSSSRWTASQEFLAAKREADERVDALFGFEPFSSGEPRLGWLLNMLPTTLPISPVSATTPTSSTKVVEEIAGLELFFLQQDGSTFKATVVHKPYFYLLVDSRWCKEVKAMLERDHASLISSIDIVDKEDLDLSDHLSGLKRRCLKISFSTVANLMSLRKTLLPAVLSNMSRTKVAQAYENVVEDDSPPENLLECCLELREYDVPYYTRVSIDLGINVGAWYIVKQRVGDGEDRLGVDVVKQEIVEKAEPRVLAFDIECTKQPLKFPEAENDQVFMISYMFDGQGYLIINREIVSEDIQAFEYTPKPDFPGPFEIFNEADEEQTLRRFFEHCRELRPNIWVTYNGDFFDFPFIETRAKKYDMDMRNEIGVFANREGEYRGRCSVHIDCLYWVNRDSYLPAGSRGLKAVTKAKLGYDPVEVDPEEMVRFAQEKPHHMAAYSVSDAVATYYLFEKYINLFVFSLCTIIPMGPDDVLRKGSGTLCEMLLMVEAFRGNILCPNKQVDAAEKFTDGGHLLEQETYIGGHVECLETGVYRNDIAEKFRLDPAAFDELIANIDRDLTFAIEVESGIPRREVTNYDQVRDEIIEALELLRDTPNRIEVPSIYHLDVAAMYPNIILSNRLQPSAMVDETACASCSFNTGPDASCKRRMEWMWRGEYYPCSKADYNRLKTQIEFERFDGVPYHELPKGRKATELKKRVKTYCQTVYKRVKDTEVVEKKTTICQRENPFYVNTVRAFRDRRYDYKGLTKKWSKIKSSLENNPESNPIEVEEAKNKVLVYDSLQLAHKCILNSFYGYVMRKGARWHSMEMAGVVTHTGGNIIKQARKLVERVGRPLELDTDGIWCILPGSFPENYAFSTSSGRSIPISYPCVMLNADVHAHFTNHQYQDLVANKQYETHSECSIFFEVDGPYRCMVLPASIEEGKLLKKRYAVFNFDGTLAELKGFELKRRGELKIIKIFQSQVFEKFLQGDSLATCYKAVAEIADYWLDVLFSRGKDLTDEEVIDLISENRSMSRNLEDYGEQKSTSITTARRLAEFLGDDLIKNKGLSCKLLIARQPHGAPTTERAIPTAIFSTEPEMKREFLCRWLKDNSLTDLDVRSIIDWDYYIDRLGKAVQKIITIPAALQNVENPVPRVQHPDWLLRNVREKLDTYKQKTLSSMFGKKVTAPVPDLEDMFRSTSANEREDHDIINEDDSESELERKKKDKAKGPEEGGDDADGADVEEEVKMDESNFDGWLHNRKLKWKRMRVEQKRRLEQVQSGFRSGTSSAVDGEDGSQLGNLDGGRRGLLSYMGKAKGLVNGSYWQILEARPQRAPGLFKLFVLSGKNEMQTVFVKMRRTFFINLTRPETGDLPKWISMTPCDWTLPHRHPRYHLYRVDVEEEEFQKHAKALAEFCNRPEVAGLYEMQLPLLNRLITRVGCVARIFETVVKERLKDGRMSGGKPKDPFAVSEIQQLVHTVHPYLEGVNAQFRRLFVYQAGSPGRELVALFQVDDTYDWLDAAGKKLEEELEHPEAAENQDMSAEEKELVDSIRCSPKGVKVFVWISLQRGGGDRRKPNFASMLADTLESVAPHLKTNDVHFDSVSVEYEPTLDACWRGLDVQLLEYRNIRKGATLIVMQSEQEQRKVTDKVAGLGHFPCVWMSAHKDEGRLPALQWQAVLGRRAVEKFLSHSLWLYNRIRCARYAHLPLSHIGDDFSMTMADTFLMRHLIHNKHVLWASPSSIPDLGGLETDTAHLHQILEDEATVNVSSPGTYRSFCVEIDILHLAVNTVLQASRVHEIEGNGGSLALQDLAIDGLAPNGGAQQLDSSGSVIRSKVTGSGALLGSAGECLSAFKNLRRMVQNWYSDIHSPDSEFADALLIHFYRWLCSPQSLLYDPALHKFIHQMMLKVFLQLLAEMRRLGAKVVHANFQRMLICTSKNDYETAQAYCDHLIRTVRNQPLFESLQLETRKVWQGIVFMDEENYGGVIARDPAYIQDMENTDIRPFSSEPQAISQVERATGRKRPATARQSEEGFSSDDGAIHDGGELEGYDLVGDEQENDDENNTDGVDSENRKHSEGRSLRERKKGGVAVTASSKTRRTLAEEEERIRKYKAGQVDDSDGDESDVEEDVHMDMQAFKKAQRRRERKREKLFGRRERQEDVSEEEEEEEEEGYEDEYDMDGFVVDDAQGDAEGMEGEEGPPGKYEVEVSWNMALYLPRELHDYFLWIVGEFILEPLKFRDEWFEHKLEEMVSNARGGKHSDCMENEQQQPTGIEEEEEEEKDARQVTMVRVEEPELLEKEEEFIKSLVEKDLTQKLIRLIPKIVATQGGAESFPKLAGSHLEYRSPALEFVKMVCAVLDLDAKIKHQVTVLRRSLLRLVGVGEFDPEAMFENPSLTLVVKDLICTLCNYCTDLDLCRNTHLMENPDHWTCQECGNPYDKAWVESLLVQRVNNLAVAFELQDLECSKCGQVRADTMSESCSCSGAWRFTMPVARQKKLLRPFLNVANYYNMEWLAHAVHSSLAQLK